MNREILPALGGVAVAIAITTTMDATGYTMFSALPLFPLAGLFWYLQKFSRVEIGLTWGPARHYGLALAYPVLVLGTMAAIAYLFDAIDTSEANWDTAFLNMAIMSAAGPLILVLTEEGFFRGWLWAALKRSGQSDIQVLIWSSVAFTAWHVSAISLDTGFDLPASEIPIFLINATLVGGVFGIIRMISGSVVAPSLCHAVWNGVDYPLFGFGEEVGALGIRETQIYGPEVGILGIGLNLVFFACLWRRFVTQGAEISSNIH